MYMSLRGVRRQLAAALTSPHGPSARQVAFLLVRAEQDQQPEEGMYLQLLAQSDQEIARASTLSTTFLAMVHVCRGERLHDWIADAQSSGIDPLHRFAHGLLTDGPAVLAGLTLPVNNGHLEGQINRLKMRQAPDVRTGQLRFAAPTHVVRAKSSRCTCGNARTW